MCSGGGSGSTQALIFVLLFALLSCSHCLPAIPDPSLIIPSTTDTTNTSGTAPGATTIPAFPEQSDVASLTCPLNPNDALLHSLSLACKPASGSDPITLSKCCPSLAVYLYAAYAATSLQATSPSVATSARPDPLPVLPDDAEACSGAVDRVLREKGVDLPRGNGTCDLALCGCGVKLRRMTCPSGMFTDVQGMWVPVAGVARRLEKDCARPGLNWCGRCLRSLNLLKNTNGNMTAVQKMKESGAQQQECQLMGITWLLLKNATHYRAAVTGALRALIAADLAGLTVDPTTCSRATDNLPLAVGSAQINGQDSLKGQGLVVLPTRLGLLLVGLGWLLLARAVAL